MTYIFDTSTFSQLFHSFYQDQFPTLWAKFDALIHNGSITSTREVAREIEDAREKRLRDWAKKHKELFPTPTAAEGAFVARIFQLKHFQQVIEQKKFFKGGKNADPFVIARATICEGTVVTMESEPKNGARIPNICRHFGVPCMTLQGFMEVEKWRF